MKKAGDYEIGYKKPPKAFRFQKGLCPNPKGRGSRYKRDPFSAVEIFLETKLPYVENGIGKQASRKEILQRKTIMQAVQGDIVAADRLLKMLDVSSLNEAKHIFVRITGGLPAGCQNQQDQESV